ncbi:MAG: SDR family oxidoreductase [Lentisphaeria bacterium]|nr:SDR family oxidoreductase [Lentisphaeria bacterium]NQZ68379.1 SDR family oxidoreductase [Lentisphaeria bacterium]
MKGLDGHKVLITGGSTGIGLEIAKLMLDYGAKVVINSHTHSLSEDDLADLKKRGEIHYLLADLSQVDVPEKLIADAADVLGGLDCLINNAGCFVDKADFFDNSFEDFDKTFNLNVRGYFLLSQAFAKLVGDSQENPSIICTGSTNSIQAEKGSVLYDTSKGAILMLIKSLAVELAPMGIRVNGIAPGLVYTPMSSGVKDHPEKVKLIENQIPLGHIGSPEDIAGAACFLASSLSSYITGQMIYIDGGSTAQQIIWELRNK